MKLPRYVTVGHMKVRMTALSVLEAQERGIDGWFDYENARIDVADSLAPSVKAETALHEVLHAICYVAKMEITEEDEERFVNRITPFLLQFLRDNPTFITSLRKAAKAIPLETNDDFPK